MPKRVTSLHGHLRVIARAGNTASFEEMPQRWRVVGRFDRAEFWTSDLPLQGQMRYRSSNWLVYNKQIVSQQYCNANIAA